MSSVAILVLVLAGIGFLLFGGPLWVARQLPVSKVSLEALRWLKVVVWLTSRLAGAALLGFWLWAVTGGEALRFSLVTILVVLGLFLLVNGPLWVVVRSKAFSRGPQAPPWMKAATIWLNRVIGAGAILAGLSVSLWQWSLG